MPLQTPAPLPYFCNNTKLPGPLPTRDEIWAASGSTLSPRRESFAGGGVRIIRGLYVVKYGARVTENEGNALLFLEQYNIPIPCLYAMYYDSHSGFLHLVMQYIPGVNLQSVWNTLSTDNKASITSQLKQICTQIRSVTSPPDLIGSVCGGPVPYPMLNIEGYENLTKGPFKSDKELGTALSTILRREWENNGRHGWLSEYLAQHIPTALNGYGVVLTHGDLHMRNILVKKVLDSEASAKNSDIKEDTGQRWTYRVEAIVDWETAGWYPAYWEYASAVARFQPENDWPRVLDAVLEPYPREASFFLLVLRELQFIF